MAGRDVAHHVGVPWVFLQAVFHGAVGYRGHRRTLGLCLFLSLAAYVMLIVAGIFDEAAGLNGFGVLVTTPFTPPRGWTWLVPVSALLFVGLNVLLLERGRCTTLAAFMAALGVLGGAGRRRGLSATHARSDLQRPTRQPHRIVCWL